MTGVIYGGGDGKGKWNDGVAKGSANVKGYVCSYFVGEKPPVPDSYSVTCSFTIDNVVEEVSISVGGPTEFLMKGSSVDGVESPLTNWEDTKQVTFNVQKNVPTTMTVIGSEVGEGKKGKEVPCDGCRCSGFLMICAAPPGSAWNGFTSNTNDWQVAISSDPGGLSSNTDAVGIPCVSTSAFYMDGGENAEKIWGPKQKRTDPNSSNNAALFRTVVTDGCGSMPPSVGRTCVDEAFHRGSKDLTDFPSIKYAPGAPTTLIGPHAADWYQMWGKCSAGPSNTGYASIPVPHAFCGTYECGPVCNGVGSIKKVGVDFTCHGADGGDDGKEGAGGGSTGGIVAVLLIVLLGGGGFAWWYRKKKRGEPITFGLPSWIRGMGQRRRHRNQMARATGELERVAAEAAAANKGSGYVPPTEAATATPAKADVDDAPEGNGRGGGGGEGDLLGIEADDDGSTDPLGEPFGNSALASI